MSNTNDLLHAEIYPALYGNIANALPEFQFKQTRGGYVSTTDHKITGESGKAGKVYAYSNRMGYLKDYTRGFISIWDYIQRRDNLSTNKEVLERLAGLAGVTLPPLDQDAQDRIIKGKTRAQIWEDANSYFIYCLNSDSKKAQEVKTYLLERGYTEKDIEQMGLGYIPSQKQLFTYLTETKGHDKATVEDTINLHHKGIGTTNVLTIPYRDPVSRIKGIGVRAIDPDPENKYLYSSGEWKSEILFNLRAVKGDKDLIVVEGLLDSLIATARGIDNVVALGSNSINKTQIETALRYGAKKFTLCLDNDTSGRDGTLRALELLQDQERVYVAQLPEGVKDPDELIRSDSVLAFMGAIAEALPYWKYTLNNIYRKYTDIAGRNEDRLTEKEKDSLLEEIVAYSQTINNPVDRDQYLKQFTAIEWVETIGITQESLRATVEKLRYKKDKEKQGEKLNKLLAEAKDLHRTGEIDRALSKLQEEARIIGGMDKKQDYEKLLQIPQEDEIKKTLQGEADSIETGYTLRDQLGGQVELSYPSGALSIISGRTSHRKTGLMLNTALNTAQRYPDKEIHFFSYEESQEALLIKLLNIYVNKDFKTGTNNLRYIKGYFKTGGDTYKNPDFLEGKERFFKELIYSGRLRVHYSPLSIDGLTGAIEYLTSRGNVGAVFVDYIQLLRIEGTFQSRQLQLQEICERLRETAIKTRLPIILGAQFNREVQMEGDIDPGKIREAGDIEQTANLVVGLWDRAFTKENQGKGKEHKDRRGETAKYEPGVLYIEILKGRDVGVGSYGELRYNGNTGRIENKPYTPGF